VARDPSAEGRTGWVYRSEPGLARVEPAPREQPSWLVPSRPAPPRLEPRAAAPPPQPARGWIASGFYVVTLPMALTVGMMLAPVIWMFGARPRQ
jgi:hypothetical protein